VATASGLGGEVPPPDLMDTPHPRGDDLANPLRDEDLGIDTPDKGFQPYVPALLLYGLVFCLGWLLHRQTDLLEIVRRRWWVHSICAGLLVFPALVLGQYESLGPKPHLREMRLLDLLVYALLMWSWVLALLGVFLHFRNAESRFWR